MRPRRSIAVPVVLVLVGLVGLLPVAGAAPGATADAVAPDGGRSPSLDRGAIASGGGVPALDREALPLEPAIGTDRSDRLAVGAPRSSADGVGHAPIDVRRPDLVIRIDLQADGDARWTVTSRYDLATNESRAAFESLVADVRNGTAPAGTVGYATGTFRRFADRVESALDRSGMRIERPRWRGRVENGTGILSLSFTWTNFARTDGDRVLLGDVFEADVWWFSHLEPGQQLVIAPPEDYVIEDYSLERPYEDFRVHINGSANLSAMDVVITYEPIDEGTPTDTATPTITATPTPGNGTPVGPEREGGNGLLFLGGVAILLAVLAVAVYAVRGGEIGGVAGAGDGDEGGPDRGDVGVEDGGTATESGTEGSLPSSNDGTAAEAGSAPESTPASGTTAASGTGAQAETGEVTDDADSGAEATTDDTEGDETDDSEDPEIDETLLSDEERVERLLQRNGGRMKQANIVTETGWSNAKVSQLLSSMDEADRIDKLRIGRENLITLPDEDVTDFE